ncbi:MAG: hypothetical protein AAFU73_23935 [Planctomycetota bacterium]
MRQLAAACIALATTSVAHAQAYVDITPPGDSLIWEVRFDPVDPQHLLARGDRIHESFDGGGTWTELTALSAAFGRGRARLDANGDLIHYERHTPLPGSIQRTTSAGTVTIPSPVLTNPIGTVTLGDVEAHPTRPSTLAAVVFDTGAQLEFNSHVYVTEDDGATWYHVTYWGYGLDTGGVMVARFGFEDPSAYPKLLVHGDYSDQSLQDTYVRSSGPMGGSVSVYSTFTYHCRVAASRTTPGRMFAAGSTYPARTIERTDPGQPWVPVGETGFFDEVATGNVDPELVVRQGNPAPSGFARFWVSRDSGETWSELVDLASAGYRASQLFGLSTLDDAVIARISSSSPTMYKLIRIPLEDPIGSEECVGAVNSTGRAGELRAIGESDATSNRTLLSIRRLPPDVFFLPLAGRTAGFVPNPGGSDGDLCIGTDVGRMLGLVGSTTPWGEGSARVDLTEIPGPNSTFSAMPGETWRFQVWYRDTGSAAGSNLTNSIAIAFQ